jgi:hypothetical protein
MNLNGKGRFPRAYSCSLLSLPQPPNPGTRNSLTGKSGNDEVQVITSIGYANHGHGVTPGVITTTILAWADLRKMHGPSCLLLLAIALFRPNPHSWLTNRPVAYTASLHPISTSDCKRAVATSHIKRLLRPTVTPENKVACRRLESLGLQSDRQVCICVYRSHLTDLIFRSAFIVLNDA